MKAVVLCAGLGTRLQPLTERWPKPALPLLGQPLLRYNLAVLRRAGVNAVGINTHHLPAVMEAVAQEECRRAGLSLEVTFEPVIQGTGGGIRGLKRWVDGDAFAVLNGDILFGVDLASVVSAHRASGAAATMVLMPMPQDERYAAVEMDCERRIQRIAGHGPGGEGLSAWHFTGVHVLSPAVFDFMSERGPEDINRDVYPRMMARGLVVRGAVVQAYWSDLGTPARYLGTQRDLLFDQVPLSAFPGASPFAGAERGAGHYWAQPGAVVEGDVAGPAFFDARSSVEPKARIGAAVYVANDARVRAGAAVNRSCVLDETEVRPGELLEDCIAWRQHRLTTRGTAPGCR